MNEQRTLYLIQYSLDHHETLHKSYVQYIRALYKVSWCYGDYEGDYGNLNFMEKNIKNSIYHNFSYRNNLNTTISPVYEICRIS